MSEEFKQFILKRQAEEKAQKETLAQQRLAKLGNNYKNTRDRNPDGTVNYTYDFAIEDANNESFTGEKLQTSFNEIKTVAENNLDTKGRNSMQADLDANNNKLINVANPVALLDGVNLKTLQSYITQGSNTLADAGSNSAENNVYLQLPYTLENLQDGFVISFIAPFTATVEQFKANKRYEQIGLLNPNEEVPNALIKPIARAPYIEDDTYTDGIKDNRPSFIQGKRYTLQYSASLDAFVTKDDKQQGEVITLLKDYGFTPAGYIDLAYNYEEYGNVGDFPYLASHQPQLTLSDPDNEESEKIVTSEVGKEEISMLPEHEHVVGGGATRDGGALNSIFPTPNNSPINTKNTISIGNYAVGDTVKPATKYIRFLVKM